ncbi:MAG TPA: acetylxylan esterase [Halococcus sp.]|nr:acetylxylan esterase [Halococcus sp.]
MDGFRAAVNGYYDAADQLSRYVQQRAADGFAAEREEKRAIDSQSEFETRRECIREDFLSAIGGLPDRPDCLAVETTGLLNRDGYSVELLTFESFPDFHVTANCYVPEGDGPHPAILFLCGHTEAAKTDPENQKACIELALNGFIVLIVDPLCQGERMQYCGPETGETLVSGAGGVFAHCYAGQQCFYAGSSLARYLIHDARCALDYLEGRSDVDTGRIGVTGTSGGGVQTAYLALVDDRIDAAAPCCAITERREWLKTGKRIDAEQVVFGAIPCGINYDDFITAMAPRPVCIGAAASDEYFPIEGVHETVERTRRVYDQYDATENVELVVADTTHCSVYELGEGIFEWLCDHLGDTGYVSHELSVVNETDLYCTPDGSIRAAYTDEQTINNLLSEYVTEHYSDTETPSATDRDGYSKRLRQTLIETFGLDRQTPDVHPRYIRKRESAGLTVEHVFFKTERDPDIVCTGVLISDPDAATRSPAVVCYERGTDELPERREDVASLAAEYGTVFIFNPRGVGAVRNRTIPIPNWIDDYYGVYGTEFKLAYDALLLGESLFGMRVYDVLRALEFLRAETGEGEVTLFGEGIGAYHALYAGTVCENVGAITLRELGPSFSEMATQQDYPYDPRLTVFDALSECDVPHLLAALRDRDVTVEQI